MARENNRAPRRTEDDGMIKKLICVNRVTKVVKGGRNMRFAALVVVGDGAGKIGYAMGKANEVPDAIEKATQRAKRAMTKVALVNTTIPHEVIGKFNRGSILMMPASAGTGVTGTAKGDQNAYTITLSTDSESYPYELSTEAIASLS